MPAMAGIDDDGGRACTEGLAARRSETRRMKSRPVLFMDRAANVRASVRDCERETWREFLRAPVRMRGLSPCATCE